MDKDQLALYYYLEGFNHAFFIITMHSVFIPPYANAYQYGYETGIRLKKFQQSINKVNKHE